MGGIFNYDGKFARALQKVSDVIVATDYCCGTGIDNIYELDDVRENI